MSTSPTVYQTAVFLLFQRHTYMLIGRLLVTLGIKCIKIFSFYFDIFLIYLLPILAYEFIKFQRGCDAWQVTAKIAQPCIFHTKSHECTVNCAISSRNFSNHYIIQNQILNKPTWRLRDGYAIASHKLSMSCKYISKFSSPYLLTQTALSFLLPFTSLTIRNGRRNIR